MSRHVALIGANGKIGPSVHQALLSAGFKVTVLSRKSSKTSHADSVSVRYFSDEATVDELVEVLKGTDALVATVAGSNIDLQKRLADAAVRAGLRTFIPADFGSCDSTSPKALELVPLYGQKNEVGKHLQKLASTSQLSWTSLVCGHFFDWGLEEGLLQVDVKNRKATIFDGGDIRWSATTIDTIGLATARILQKEEETKNKMLYIQSFCVTQNEILASVEKATGQKFEVKHVSSNDFITRTKKEMEDSKNAEAVENMVSVLGIIDANWELKDNFANSLLGLKDDDLDAVVKAVVSKCEGS
ncbi:MAG: hypothetical protein MMC23_004421 [Stictis urceolatum]|nr:hypothetical protein [Stictis urceolata]